MSKPVIKSFVNIAQSAVKQGTKNSIIETAVSVTAQAKSLTPVDTGQLKGSIMWKTNRTEGGHTEGDKLSITPKSDLSAVVGTAVEHGVYQEFGTRNMDAQPYLRPAVSIVTEKSGFQAAVSKAMADTVREKMRGVR